MIIAITVQYNVLFHMQNRVSAVSCVYSGICMQFLSLDQNFNSRYQYYDNIHIDVIADSTCNEE